jgi:hypothetical protein
MDRNKRTTLFSVLGITAVIAVMAVAGVVLGRRIGNGITRITGEAPTVVINRPGNEQADQPVKSRTALDFTGFDSIETSGGWIIEAVQGDVCAVALESASRYSDDIEISQRGDTLRLELDSAFGSVVARPIVSIVMPDLESLECDGSATIALSGFELDRLVIDIDGAASVTAEDSQVEDLDLSVDGASTIDFSQSEVVDADIDMDGASTLRITMDGGELTGSLNGVGNVIYGGHVSAERVQVGGIGKVRPE